MRVVVALGGNALLERGKPADATVQRRHVRVAARALAPLADQHELVICHGNGPQVGMLAIESEEDSSLIDPYPLDVLGAQTQGMIGYWLGQELRNEGVARPIACVLTQTIVDSFDPAFDHPTKFVGPVYHRHHALHLAARRGWHVAADGPMWRRVVPSPQPRRILELPVLRQLVAARTVVVCAGGGGAPVIEDDTGQLLGVDAVVDKDLAAALLARELHADALLLLTDVPGLLRNFGTDAAEVISQVGVAEVSEMEFPAGSMGPKVEACVRFALADAARVLGGTAGTVVVPSPIDRETGRYVHAGTR